MAINYDEINKKSEQELRAMDKNVLQGLINDINVEPDQKVIIANIVIDSIEEQFTLLTRKSTVAELDINEFVNMDLITLLCKTYQKNEKKNITVSIPVKEISYCFKKFPDSKSGMRALRRAIKKATESTDTYVYFKNPYKHNKTEEPDEWWLEYLKPEYLILKDLTHKPTKREDKNEKKGKGDKKKGK